MKNLLSPYLLREHFIVPSLDRYPMSHAPFLASLDDQRLILIWFAGSREWAKDVRLLAAVYHTAIGKWDPIFEFVNDVNYSLGNSVFLRDGRGGYHLWYVRTKGYWGEGEVVHLTFNDPQAPFTSKTVLTLEKGWLVRGRALLRGDVAYLPVYQENTSECAVWEQQLSTGNGKLQSSMTAQGGLIHPVLVAPDSDEFRCLMRNPHQPNRIHLAFSMNRGVSWSRPFPTSLPNPNSGLDALLLDRNRLICAYNDSPRDRYPLSLALSLNGGVEWNKVGDLEVLPGEYSYPSLLAENGNIHLAYTYKRESIKFITLNPELF